MQAAPGKCVYRHEVSIVRQSNAWNYKESDSMSNPEVEQPEARVNQEFYADTNIGPLWALIVIFVIIFFVAPYILPQSLLKGVGIGLLVGIGHCVLQIILRRRLRGIPVLTLDGVSLHFREGKGEPVPLALAAIDSVTPTLALLVVRENDNGRIIKIPLGLFRKQDRQMVRMALTALKKSDLHGSANARMLGCHPDGFWAALPRHAKIMGWVTPLWIALALFATRQATSHDFSPAAVLIPLLSCFFPFLAWIVWGVWDSARSRGSHHPAVWAIAAIPALILSPIGLIIFMVVYSMKLSGSTGWCSTCKKRVRQSLESCPHCRSSFVEASPPSKDTASAGSPPQPVPSAAEVPPAGPARKAITSWKELKATMDALTGGASTDASGRTIEDVRQSCMLQALYFGFIKYHDGYDDVPFMETGEVYVDRARAFQGPIPLPGPFSFIGKTYDPVYTPVASGDSYVLTRAGDPNFDMLINSVAACLKNHPLKYTNASPSDLAMDAIKHYSHLPVVRFFASLPYLHDHLPERGERFILADYECSLLRCVDGILFRLYDELDEGQVIDDTLIVRKVKNFFAPGPVTPVVAQ